MIEKELFKNQIIYLFRGHGINEIDNEMVRHNPYRTALAIFNYIVKELKQ